MDFNSIKVRLEPSFVICFPLLRANFNSIKVRLERRDRDPRFRSQYAFQFHKGTIRTSVFARFSRVLDYFNSIKVRLELTVLLVIFMQIFNFNSIKVRLEHRHDLLNSSSVTAFQFHKGTIRTASHCFCQ